MASVDLHIYGWDDEREREFEPLRREGLLPARVLGSNRLACRLISADGELSGRLAGRLCHACGSRGDLPTVGDWVAFRPSTLKGPVQIEALLGRRSAFSRKAAGKGADEQVIAANVDTILIVTGLDSDLSVRRLERYVTLAGESGAGFVIVLNKADLCDDLDRAVSSITGAFGDVPVHATSALDERGLEAIEGLLSAGRTYVLLGSSGVGKSTIINRLLGEDRLRTARVSDHDGRGRHTTTAKDLMLLPSGAIVIDTPGLRELQLLCTGEGLRDAFSDIDELSAGCRYRDCTHSTEPGCAVLAAVQDGRVPEERVASYHRLQREIGHNLSRSEARFRNKRSERWKQISRLSKRIQKDKRTGSSG